MSTLSLWVLFALAPPSQPEGWSTALSPAQQQKCLDEAPAKIARLVSIDPEQATRLTQLAFNNKIGVVMRPIGKGAPDLRAAGYSPKPLAIKWKTCNKIDMEIGAPPQCLSALVLFKPHLPAKWPDNLTDKRTWENRVAQRMQEWNDAHHDGAVAWTGDYARVFKDKTCSSMTDKQIQEAKKKAKEEGKPYQNCLVGYRTADGFIRDARNGLPFTGDLDLFDIADASGRQLTSTNQAKIDAIDGMISEQGLDVLHEAHVDWDTSGLKDKDPEAFVKSERIRLTILDVHRERPEKSPRREPLVIVKADCTVCQAWAQPHPSDPYARSKKPDAAWTYKCIDKKLIDPESPKLANWPPPQPPESLPDLSEVPPAPIKKLKYVKGNVLFIKPAAPMPDQTCFQVTVTKANAYKDGTGAYEYKNAYGGVSGDEAAAFEQRASACAGPPPKKKRKLHAVGTSLRIRSRPDDSEMDCFHIEITRATLYEDGTGAYEFKNDGGGVSGDDADGLDARTCSP